MSHLFHGLNQTNLKRRWEFSFEDLLLDRIVGGPLEEFSNSEALSDR